MAAEYLKNFHHHMDERDERLKKIRKYYTTDDDKGNIYTQKLERMLRTTSMITRYFEMRRVRKMKKEAKR